MKYRIIILTLLLTACTSELREYPKPDYLIPEDRMVLVLKDLMVLEYHIQSRFPRPEQFQECMRKSGDAILKKHHENFEHFDASMEYYAANQEKMQEIYQRVMDLMQEELQHLQAADKQTVKPE